MPQKLLRQLAAIMLGNLAYFSMLPHLPAGLRHQSMSLDPGLLLDFGFCVVCYFLLGLIPGERSQSSGTTK